MDIHQGGVYWVQLETPDELEPRIPHPHVVVEVNDKAGTVVVCGLTSNIHRISLPGNVLLEAGEASLLRQSLVEVSKVVTVDQARLGEYIGTLSEQRVTQILAGIRFVERAYRRLD